MIAIILLVALGGCTYYQDQPRLRAQLDQCQADLVAASSRTCVAPAPYSCPSYSRRDSTGMCVAPGGMRLPDQCCR